jgi:hypothetical protein
MASESGVGTVGRAGARGRLSGRVTEKLSVTHKFPLREDAYGATAPRQSPPPSRFRNILGLRESAEVASEQH